MPAIQLRLQNRCAALWALGGAALLLFLARPASAQALTQDPPLVPGARPLTVQHIRIPGAALAGNLEGNAVDRPAIVILPPGYSKHPRRRYPVVYALHGYSIGAAQWTHEIRVPQTVAGAFARGARPMIVVLPDSKTLFGGSMYSSSVTTGDFERYIFHDVVAYMDAHYRTIPRRWARGLVGHSMGGYGALRIGMQHPEVFASLYVMSACCLSPMGARPSNPAFAQAQARMEKQLESLKSPAQAAHLSFFARAMLASAAAWSPDPQNPPFFFDLPFKNGRPQPDIQAKWAANAPLAFLDQYIDNLRRYRAIALDVGDQDGLRFDMIRLHRLLDRYRIRNRFELYHGTHTSHVAFRFQNHVLPFFSRHLCAAAPCR